MNSDKCRLCLTNTDNYLDIFSNVGVEKNLLEILKLHFSSAITEINNDDFYSNRLCRSCWTTIESFHNFYLKIKTIQNDFLLQHNNSICIEEENIFDKTDSKALSVQPEITDVSNDTDIDYELENEEDIPLAKIIAINRRKCVHKTDIGRVKNKKKIDKENNIKTNKRIRDSEIQDNEQICQFFTMECNLCASEKFSTFREVKSHYLRQHKIKRGYIICCKRKFKFLTSIREHIMWHKNPEDFTCKLCNKLYVNKCALDNHKLSHEPEMNRLHKCDVCEKTFTRYYQMKQHKLNHTLSSMEKTFKCETCGSGFPKEYLLRNHKRVVHEGVYSQTFICDICANVFKSKITFNRHRNEEHLGIKSPKIQCQLCGAWIKNEYYLKRHMKIHQEETKDFYCKYCNKKSASREALRKHENYVHVLKATFNCTFCDKIFKRSIQLKEHLTTHTGEILYTCKFCTKTSNSKANMNSHKLKVHKDEWEIYKIDNKL